MTEQPDEIQLDDEVLERLADLICGDEPAPKYRRGFEIEKFFKAARWERVGHVDGSRRAWVIETITRLRHKPGYLRQLVLRLADPREYLDEPQAHPLVLAQLNELLVHDGYQVTITNRQPQLVPASEDGMNRAESRKPLELTVDLADLVNDEEFGKQLTARLSEAKACAENGAPLAAIIMLGSVMEGVLFDVASSRREGQKVTDNLDGLIKSAQQQGWLAKDITDYLHVLRGQRNLVHPRRQYLDGCEPNDDRVRIAWNIVVATLNDLQRLASQHPAAV